MKRILFIFISVLLCGASALSQAQEAEEVMWYSIGEAVQLASEEPRVIVVDVYTDWCGWCKRMDATTFSDPGVAKKLNRDFYPVKLNAEGKKDIVIGDRTYRFVDNGRRGYHEVAAIVTRGRLSYPTISYVNPEGEILDASPGYKTPDQFMVYLAYYADGAYKTRDFQEFAAEYLGQSGGDHP